MYIFSTQYSQTEYKNRKTLMHNYQEGFVAEIQEWYNIPKSINITNHLNKMKNKNYSVISIDAGKAFNKMQHSLI